MNSNATLQHILAAYGLPYIQIYDVQKGYRNQSFPVLLADGRTVNIIIYKREPGMLARIRRANAVADFLCTQNFPARKNIGRILRLQGDDQPRYTALYNYLPGNTIPWEGYTKNHIKALGMVMGKMHTALESFDVALALLPSVADEYAAIVARMQAYFHDEGVRRAMLRKLKLTVPERFWQTAEQTIIAAGRLPHQQALHMDFVRGNILFEPNMSCNSDLAVVISGILDFEKTGHGHPLFDIARTLAFLLVDCKYTPEAKVRKYFLQSGYCKRGGHRLQTTYISSDGHKHDLLEELLDIFLLYDFYKFLQHNPYEALGNNEHFVRTSKLLQRRGVVVSSIS